MWSPLLTLEAMLLSVQQLMAHPNGSDGLSKEVTDVYNSNRAEWERRAREMTAQQAALRATSSAAGSQETKEAVTAEPEPSHAKVDAQVDEGSDGKRKREEEASGTAGDSDADENVDKRVKVG